MTDNPDVVIIGAGPAGLAVAAGLRRREVPFVLLERNDTIGSSWHGHYERLHLNTVRWLSSLPGLPWAEHIPPYPSRQQMIDYLVGYAKKFDIEPRYGAEVERACHDGLHWVTRTKAGEFRSNSLVVATGACRIPNRPAWPGQDLFRGQILHSAQWRSAAAFRGQRALVIGAGSSAAEIAMELWEQGAETTMAVRGGVHIVPRDPFRFPVQVLAATLFDHLPVAAADRLATALLARPYRHLASYGIRPPALGPGARAAKEGRLPTVDTGTIELIRQRMIRIVPEPSSFDAAGITFSDGRSLPFDVVVLATGFHGGLEDFLPDAARYTDSRGSPLWHGDTGPIPGLYFVGFHNSISGPLRELGVEAARVVECLQRS